MVERPVGAPVDDGSDGSELTTNAPAAESADVAVAESAADDDPLATRLRQAYVTHALAGLLPARRNAFAKRALDLTLGLLLLALALPLLGALALAIRSGWLGRAHDGAMQDKPAVFVRQRYAGRGGRVFVGASLPALRATRLRRLARLPLLVNVVRGEMSLVGPPPALYDEWIGLADPEGLRARSALAYLYIKPGLTGPWLLQRASRVAGVDDDVTAITADSDGAYIAHGSFWRDLAILAQTPLALLRK